MATTGLLLTVAACPKPPAAPPASWADLPRLPSPSAGSYARAPAESSDRPLAELLAGHTWDASLSGAATAVALRASRSEDTAPWFVRHAGWTAGYPYPIDTLSIWRTGAGAAPPQELIDWLTTRPSTGDLGLVRARNDQQDVWVALTASPQESIGVQPRQLPRGAVFTLPKLPGATFEVADGLGRVQAGRLDLAQTFTADAPGEWVVKIMHGTRVIAWYPLYVERIPPTEPIVGTRTEGDVLERTEALVDAVRERHGLGPLDVDLLFDTAAARLLQDGSMPSGTLAARVGWDPKKLARWDVRGPTVAAALDRVIWEPAARPALLARTGRLGLAVEEDGSGVHIVVVIGFD